MKDSILSEILIYSKKFTNDFSFRRKLLEEIKKSRLLLRRFLTQHLLLLCFVWVVTKAVAESKQNKKRKQISWFRGLAVGISS